MLPILVVCLIHEGSLIREDRLIPGGLQILGAWQTLVVLMILGASPIREDRLIPGGQQIRAVRVE